jgi:hypothetical protein
MIRESPPSITSFALKGWKAMDTSVRHLDRIDWVILFLVNPWRADIEEMTA